MDGRLFRKWCVFGCLMAAAVGCNRNNKQSPFGQMPDRSEEHTSELQSR